MARLPPNVYSTICRLLDRDHDVQSLAVISRTCSALQIIAEPRLYEVYNGGSPSVTRTVAFFGTLATCPRVSSYVHEISVYHTVPVYVPADFFQTVARGMAAIKGPLRHFIFAPSCYNRDAEPFPSHSIVLRDCMAKVSRLYIQSYWDTHLVDFLERQGDALRHLSIGSYPRNCAKPNDPPPRLPRDALPRLSKYDGPAEHASQLFPGRAITHCLMRPHINKERSGRHIAAHSSAQRLNTALSLLEPVLLSLHVANVDLYEDLTLDIMRHAFRCPQLRYLGKLALPTATKRVEFYQFLVSMRALAYIELSLSYYSKPTVTEQIVLYFAHELKTYCPSIRTIIFTYYNYDHPYRVKLCAVDNDEEPMCGWTINPEESVNNHLWQEV